MDAYEWLARKNLPEEKLEGLNLDVNSEATDFDTGVKTYDFSYKRGQEDFEFSKTSSEREYDSRISVKTYQIENILKKNPSLKIEDFLENHFKYKKEPRTSIDEYLLTIKNESNEILESDSSGLNR